MSTYVEFHPEDVVDFDDDDGEVDLSPSSSSTPHHPPFAVREVLVSHRPPNNSPTAAAAAAAAAPSDPPPVYSPSLFPSEQEQALSAQFCSVTGLKDTQKATVFLNLAGGDLEKAVGLFLSKLGAGPPAGRRVAASPSADEKSPPTSPSSGKGKKKSQGWKAVVDPNSGHTYYYNKATKETRWDRPEDFDHRRVVAAAEPASSSGVVEKKKQVWKSVVDPNTGQTYYYNKSTKETVWDKPRDYDDEIAAATPAPAVEKKEEEEEQAPKVPKKGRWKSKFDENTGKTYYYHTGRKEMTWVKPDDLEEEEGVRGVPPPNGELPRGNTGSPKKAEVLPRGNAHSPKRKEEKLAPTSAGSSTSSPKAVAVSTGWKSVIDAETGETYYYQARWDKPEDFDDQEGGEEGGETIPTVVVEEEKPGVEMQQQQQPKKDKGRPRWKAVVDAASGRTYYYDKSTKETRWDKPEGFDEQQAERADGSKSPKRKGSGRWKSASDEKSGRTYYYHTGTKQISWERPVDFEDQQEQKTAKSPPPSPQRSPQRPQARLPYSNNSPPRTYDAKTTTSSAVGDEVRDPPGSKFDDLRRSKSEEEEAEAERRLRHLEEAQRARRAEEEEARQQAKLARQEAQRRAFARRMRAKQEAQRCAPTTVEAEPTVETNGGGKVVNRTPREMEEILARANGWRR